MKLIIAGGRNYRLSARDLAGLDAIHEERGVTRVLSGGAAGADQDGIAWARRNKIPVDVFPPDWKEFGPSAGPRRNHDMAEVADALACFPGGKGTGSMRQIARRRGLEIFDLREKQEGETK